MEQGNNAAPGAGDIKSPPVKWYLNPIFVVLMLMLLGPFALPLLWITPHFSKITKIVVTIVIILLTWITVVTSVKLYDLLKNQLEELSRINSGSF